jgi:hypothetical protein
MSRPVKLDLARAGVAAGGPMGTNRSRSRRRSQSVSVPVAALQLAALAAALALPSAGLLAQQPPANTVTLTGVVTDVGTGAAVSGALVSLGDRGPRAIADSLGRFRISNVPAGSYDVLVQRFGYVNLQVRVTVTATPEPLQLRLAPDPLQLEGLTVTGNARAPLSGLVLDAVSGAPLPWTSLWLSQDAVREAGRGAADEQGVFSIPNVLTGSYLLRVEKLGYHGQYIPISHAAPPEALEVRLEPDSVLLKGLAELNSRLGARRRSSSGQMQSYGEARLQLSAMAGMRQFLQNDAMVPLFPCTGRESRMDCRDLRGRLVAPRVYIDEVPAAGLDQLDSYQPQELYTVDVFVCGPGDRLGGWEIRVYTHAFMERQARRGRGMFAHCLVP